MNIKKVLLSTFIVILAISVIAASVLPATVGRIKKGEKAEFYNGRYGVAFTKSQYSGYVRLDRMSDSRIQSTNHPKFHGDLVKVSLTKIGGGQVRSILGAVYVFVVVKQSDVRAWERGELGLYVFDTWHNEWVECGSFLVKNGGGRPRVACRMNAFGIFGLAEQ
jgi:hypothetical protein